MRHKWKRKNIDEETIEIMTASIAQSTISQYDSALKVWWNFCLGLKQDPFSAGEQVILKCLTNRFKEGAAYGTLNTLRSSISLINDCDSPKNSLLHRFFKGVFRLRPALPKYNSIWDVELVFKTIEAWGSFESLNLQKLSFKLVMLLALGSAYGVQSIALIKIENVKEIAGGVEIIIDELIKTSKPGSSAHYCFFPFFNERTTLCIAKTLLHYMARTQDLRESGKRLVISYRKPHNIVGSQTISRWLKTVLREARVEKAFTAHSTRHASTSKALKNGMDINNIKTTAGWSEGSNTFAKFYNRPIKPQRATFAEAVFSV